MDGRTVGAMAASHSSTYPLRVCRDFGTYAPRFTLLTSSASAADASFLVR